MGLANHLQFKLDLTSLRGGANYFVKSETLLNQKLHFIGIKYDKLSLDVTASRELL